MKQNFTTSELPHVWPTQLQDSGKAGCHTIPKTDITYIAKLLNW
jgi:hypothetical protein